MRIDRQRQLFGIRRAQLLQRAPVEDHARQWMRRGQLFEHVFGGRRLAFRRLAEHRQLELLVEDHAELLRGPEIEFAAGRSEEHTSELQSLMRISYADFCLKKKKLQKP